MQKCPVYQARCDIKKACAEGCAQDRLALTQCVLLFRPTSLVNMPVKNLLRDQTLTNFEVTIGFISASRFANVHGTEPDMGSIGDTKSCGGTITRL